MDIVDFIFKLWPDKPHIVIGTTLVLLGFFVIFRGQSLFKNSNEEISVQPSTPNTANYSGNQGTIINGPVTYNNPIEVKTSADTAPKSDNKNTKSKYSKRVDNSDKYNGKNVVMIGVLNERNNGHGLNIGSGVKAHIEDVKNIENGKDGTNIACEKRDTAQVE